MELSHTLLPAGVLPYAFQVAGHKGTTSSCDMFRHPSESIVYKRLQDNSRGFREVNFYKTVYATNVSEPLRLLRSFLPEFYGVYRCPQSQDLYLGLSDVMATFQHPNVCDVKLGTVTYRPQTEANKIQREQSKYPWRRALGFHITGMQVCTLILAFTRSRAFYSQNTWQCSDVRCRTLSHNFALRTPGLHYICVRTFQKQLIHS
ncbi:inositol-polyphosphate multikinase [Paragonimus westermani]|uniref:Kinase n=1 Tax=Paragonimus westermani TaxID=34504 RepID=A0A5J4NYW0_9TREM|nr:inositol-polyphosphate multikinase [Paragonimus westermani]